VSTRLATMVLVILSAASAGPPPPRVPVLVELFTSEGCSSCPSADALLETLQRDQPVEGVEVIALGLHVDYFNYLGWKDTFSAAAFTERQQEYSRTFGPDSVYTPQMIVDGRDAVVGNDRPVVAKAIGAAAQRPHLALHVTARGTADAATITVDLPAAPSGGERIQVLAAITQDDLTTAVQRGENKGRTLHHVAVVRKIQALDTLAATAATAESQVRLAPTWGPTHLNAVVWLQGVKTRQVYGVALAPVLR